MSEGEPVVDRSNSIHVIGKWWVPLETVAVSSALLGLFLAVGGVHVVFGIGWAMIAASVPLIFIAIVLLRGLARGQ